MFALGRHPGASSWVSISTRSPRVPERVSRLAARGATVPTYQYACTACGHRFEAVQSFSDDALTECPACAVELRKLVGSVGVVFKGSGFYRTDSRSESGGKAKATA